MLINKILKYCNIHSLIPDEIINQFITNLTALNINDCNNIRSFSQLTNLKSVYLNRIIKDLSLKKVNLESLQLPSCCSIIDLGQDMILSYLCAAETT